MNVIVVGSSGAIGSALVREILKNQQVQSLYSWSRLNPAPDSESLPVCDPRVVHGYIDLAVPDSIVQAAATIDAQSIDLVIIATGFLHSSAMAPEKSIRQLSAEQFQQSMQLNALGPALVIQQLLPKMRRDRRTICAALSARVGSISDNRLGGWYSYRSSKAALNMLLKCTALECQRSHPQLIIAGLHPGTVDSSLSQPFQRNVPEHKLFTPDFSAQQLLGVLDRLTGADSGQIFAWDGTVITP